MKNKNIAQHNLWRREEDGNPNKQKDISYVWDGEEKKAVVRKDT